MTDLLLINPGERERIYQHLGAELTAVEPPLMCRLIAGYARDRGHSVAILDVEAEQLTAPALAERVRDAGPRLVALVVFGHQPSASTQQMVGAGLIAKAIKALCPTQRIVIVGGHVAALPERSLTEEVVDFACNSEGPITVERLLAALQTGDASALAGVPGLVYRADGAVRSNPAPALIKDLDTDLHGNVWDILPMERYRAHNWQCFGNLAARRPYASIYTSLGCPYRCSFCCINAPFGTNRYRMRSPDAVVAEIVHLHDRYGVKTFKIIDEMFVLNHRHVLGICDRLAAHELDLNIWAYARVDTIRPEILPRLARAGIRWLALGIESASAYVRDGADKVFGNQDIIDAVRSIQAAGINVIGNYIFGLPDDDLASMRQTLDLATELNCEFANFYSAMAYPGSPLYATAVAEGWALPERWSGYSQHSFDCQPLATKHVSAADVLGFRDRAFDAYFTNPRYLDMVASKFGADTRALIVDMTKTKLRRKLLETQAAEPVGA
jgi:radical SAM superfamily enzyme YgiQ (UPF0313 family)